MKFTVRLSPYAALLLTGGLMLVTVVLSQLGSSAALLKAGAASVDKDLSNFAAKTFTSLAHGAEESSARPEEANKAPGATTADDANERHSESRGRRESRTRMASRSEAARESATADESDTASGLEPADASPGAPNRRAAVHRSF